MTNVTNKDIVYLNHRNSAMAEQHYENSSMSNCLANILKSGNTLIINNNYETDDCYNTIDFEQ